MEKNANVPYSELIKDSPENAELVFHDSEKLFDVEGDNYNVLAKGVADRIGIHGSFIEIRLTGQEKRKREVALPTHNEAIVEVIKELLNGALNSMDEIDAVGHRVVQGGDYFKNSVLVTDDVVEKIEELSNGRFQKL